MATVFTFQLINNFRCKGFDRLILLLGYREVSLSHVGTLCTKRLRLCCVAINKYVGLIIQQNATNVVFTNNHWFLYLCFDFTAGYSTKSG